MSTLRTAGLALAAAAALGVAGCGGGEDRKASTLRAATTASGADLGAIKQYILQHTTQLAADVGALREDAEAYYALAEQSDVDDAKLLADHRSEVRGLVEGLQDDFAEANPAYEEMEGVVAGVPRLADFDVLIDADGDASDAEDAVPFSIKTPDGRTFSSRELQLPHRHERVRHRAEVRRQGRQARPRRRRQVEFGEALPDASFLVAAARDFAANAKELDAAARK